MSTHHHRKLVCAFAILWVLTCTAPASAINIVLDYTYDSTNFFGNGNPAGAAAGAQAKASLEYAADFYSDILTDTFSEISTPAPFNGMFGGQVVWSWSMNFSNPSSNANVTLTDQTIPADEYRVFAGARTLSGNTLGVGGPGGFGWSSNPSGGFSQAEINQINQTTDAFSDDVEDREETSGFSAWGGSITFERINSDWHFDHTTLPMSSGDDDFLSIAIHELGHALGLGTSDNWNNWVSGTSYSGPKSVVEYGGLVPLECNPGCGHWADGTQSTIFGTNTPQEASLDPVISQGTRKLLTTLDAAALDDIGWDVQAPVMFASADYDTDGDVDGSDLAILENWYATSAQGDADGDGDTDGSDLLVWQQQYTGTITPLVANVPEPSSLLLLTAGIVALSCRTSRI